MSKHTLEPWIVNELKERTVPRFLLHGKGVVTVELVVRGSRDSWAVARLIAAAPELLAACRIVLDYQDDNSPYSVDDLIRFASAAVAKAEGKE